MSPYCSCLGCTWVAHWSCQEAPWWDTQCCYPWSIRQPLQPRCPLRRYCRRDFGCLRWQDRHVGCWRRNWWHHHRYCQEAQGTMPKHQGGILINSTMQGLHRLIITWDNLGCWCWSSRLYPCSARFAQHCHRFLPSWGHWLRLCSRCIATRSCWWMDQVWGQVLFLDGQTSDPRGRYPLRWFFWHCHGSRRPGS